MADIRFGARGGSSSSSLLKVRSIIVLWFLLLPKVLPVLAIDCSRDDIGGVCVTGKGVAIASLLMEATRDGSRISTKSSSLPDWESFAPEVLSPWAIGDHTPVGSMLTCSTNRDVDSRMSLTYL